MVAQMELKKPLTLDEQVNRLIEHGLVVQDREAAKRILARITYYRLSPYGIGLTIPGDKDHYQPNITFEHLYELYHFDELLRGILLPIVSQVEISIRAQISYHLTLLYGADGYMNIDILNPCASRQQRESHKTFCSRFQAEVSHQRNNLFVQHHKKKYGGRFPLWVATELFTFGMLSSLYDLLNKRDQADIASEFHTRPAYFRSWIISFVEIRNICAHYGRIYNRPLTKQPKLYQEHACLPRGRIFPVLIALGRTIQDSKAWSDFLVSLQALIENSTFAKIEYMGFPDHWLDLLQATQNTFLQR